MCRLFAHIAVKPVDSGDLLARARFSLLRQSDVPARRQQDGWGIGYYAGGRAAVVKSPGAAFREKAAFRRASGSRSRIVFGHLRAASNPRGLPRQALIGPENTQPFHWKHLLFAHNGTVEIPDAVLSTLGRYRRRVRGVNDSEAYFWQFVKHYERLGDPGEALLACKRELDALWRRPAVRAAARKAGKKRPYFGLNTLVSDGRRIHALCLYPSKAKALFTDRPWGRLVAGRRGGRVVVASEPLDKGEWEDFGDAELRVIDPSGTTLRRPVR